MHVLAVLLTQLAQPALELLHRSLEPGLLCADLQATLGMEDIEGVHRLQLDLHAQLLQHPQEVQHAAVCGDHLVVRLCEKMEGGQKSVRVSTVENE